MDDAVDANTNRGGLANESGDSVVTLDQVPCWSSVECKDSNENEDPAFSNSSFADPLTSIDEGGDCLNGMQSRFPVNHEVNSKVYLWRGNPWVLEVDAVVNSTNESLDESQSSPGLHTAAGPVLAEECATLGGCRTGMAKISKGYDLPARRVIHTVGPIYAVKYHSAVENALSHCYRSCLELLIENGLQSIAMGCIYTEAKMYPREPAAHVAIRTVRRFLEKQKDYVHAVIFCTTASSDAEIYKRLLPLYFPREKKEEVLATTKLPADVGDENGETVIDERRIRIQPLPNVKKKAVPRIPQTSKDLLVTYLSSYLDPAFMSLIKDPDQRRMEQWEKAADARNGWDFAKMLGYGDLRGPLSAAEEYSLHVRYLAKANSLNQEDMNEDDEGLPFILVFDLHMFNLIFKKKKKSYRDFRNENSVRRASVSGAYYRGGVDHEGRPVMVVVEAHFLLRRLDLERFVLYVIKVNIYLGWMNSLEQILERKHQHNLNAIYVLHPTFGLKTAIFAMQLLIDKVVWKKVNYLDRLLQLFRYIPRKQLSIPNFVFQHDLEVNGEKGVIVDPRKKYVYQRQ
ncbi:hypothetical protein SASPL_107815 [Salvia splendens]|uniref:Macro domain-containing protein n=1 Tax=Salvia splendens TaxID=180675 RepID=A0A8X9A5M8_SALSN|nr:hypothetical protein SASPL_107815 [Salvia splendens]